MKKLIAISIVLVIVSAVAFAEEKALKIGFDASIYSDLIYATKNSGEDPDGKTDAYDNVKGTFNFLSSTNTAIPGSGVSLTFTHTGEHHEASLQLGTDGLLDRLGKLSDTHWSDFLESGIGDWYIKGNAGPFDGYVGNTGYGGKVATFDVFNDFLARDKLKLNGFGVYVPSFKLDFTDPDAEPSVGASMQGSANMNAFGDDAFALGIRFMNDFRFAVGTSLSYDGWDNPDDSVSSVGGMFMFSGDNIADLLTFDLFYGVAGGDTQTNYRGQGLWKNIFGAYFGLNIVENLGISVGYTGTTLVQEPTDGSATEDKPVTTTHPWYSGISLHFNYTGIDNMGITFNNNISFAGVTGIEEEDKYNASISGMPLAKDYKENGFAWHAALKVGYALNDALTVNLQVANLLTTFSMEYGDDKMSFTKDNFRAVLTGDYTVGAVTVGAGLSMDLVSNSGTANDDSTGKSSTFTFGIPVYFKLSF